MKKFLSLCLALFFAFSLVACGGNNDVKTNEVSKNNMQASMNYPSGGNVFEALNYIDYASVSFDNLENKYTAGSEIVKGFQGKIDLVDTTRTGFVVSSGTTLYFGEEFKHSIGLEYTPTKLRTFNKDNVDYVLVYSQSTEPHEILYFDSSKVYEQTNKNSIFERVNADYKIECYNVSTGELEFTNVFVNGDAVVNVQFTHEAFDYVEKANNWRITTYTFDEGFVWVTTYSTYASTEPVANCTIVDTDYVTTHYEAEFPNRRHKTVEFITVKDENNAYSVLANYDLGAIGETVVILGTLAGASEESGLILEPNQIDRNVENVYGPFNGLNRGILLFAEEDGSTELAHVINKEFKEGDEAKVTWHNGFLFPNDESQDDINIEYVVNAGIFYIFVCDDNKAYIVNTDWDDNPTDSAHCIVGNLNVLSKELEAGNVKEVIGCSELNDIYILLNNNTIKCIEVPVRRDFFENK